jgi:hypothetical protein
MRADEVNAGSEERPLLLILVSWFGLFLSFLCSVVALPFTLWIWATQGLVAHKVFTESPTNVGAYLCLVLPRYLCATLAPCVFAMTLVVLFLVGYLPLVEGNSGLAWFIGIVLGLSGIAIVIWVRIQFLRVCFLRSKIQFLRVCFLRAWRCPIVGWHCAMTWSACVHAIVLFPSGRSTRVLLPFVVLKLS